MNRTLFSFLYNYGTVTIESTVFMARKHLIFRHIEGWDVWSACWCKFYDQEQAKKSFKKE